MDIIEIKNLNKTFKVLNKKQGFGGAFKNLFSKDYSYINAVKDISFNVSAGEIVGFVGPNGAGKSTTIKMMTGVLKPTSGRVAVNGYIPYETREKYMQEIGVVFGQRTQLWWDLPVIDSFRILKDIYRLDEATYKKSMDMFIELVSIDALFQKTVRSLSLGQRMLCDIAASFLHNPKVIFLDEPTIGLDVTIKNKIRTLIKNLNERENTTIILTTHDMRDIEALCKRIIIIDKGSIIFDGELEQVVKIFGAYRTLKIAADESIDAEGIKATLKNNFPDSAFDILRQNENWISITFRQDETELMDILRCLSGRFEIRDIMVEEIELEEIIKKIYEGGLN